MKKLQIICCCNAKGGTGKTTTSINLGAGLSQLGRRVLLVDFDPQKANMTTALGLDNGSLRYTIANLLSAALDCPEDIPEMFDKTVRRVEGMDLLPANKKLTGLCTRLSVEQTTAFGSETRAEFALHTVLQSLENQYDYIIIDCGPKLDLLMTNALVASEQAIIPVQAHYLAMEGLSDILETIKMVRQRYNPDLTVGGILLTMYQSQTNLCKNVHQQIAEHYGADIHLFENPIASSIKIAENPAFGGSLFSLIPNHPATLAYASMAKEVAYGKT